MLDGKEKRLIPTRTLLTAAAILALTGTAAIAAPVTFVVDSESSFTTLDICESVTGSCDSDSSPVIGTVELDLSTPQDPQQASILSFNFALTETLNLSYNLGFGQTLTLTGNNLQTAYALDGPTGPEPVGPGGDLFFPAVPQATAGTLSYSTSTLLCFVFQSQNLPCNDTIDLAESGIIEAPVLANLVRNGDELVLTISITAEFDSADLPDAPPISGTITTTILATAPVPAPACPADVDESGSVDLDDLNIVLTNFGQQTSNGDTNGDGVVDLDDLNTVLTAFGTECP